MDQILHIPINQKKVLEIILQKTHFEKFLKINNEKIYPEKCNH